MPLYVILNENKTAALRIQEFLSDPTPEQVPPGSWRYFVDSPAPPVDLSTQRMMEGPAIITETTYTRTWNVVQRSAEEIQAIADAEERAEVKALRDQIRDDMDESDIDKAQAQAYIDIPAPTNTERNEEVLNSAKRDKNNEQRYQRIARAVRRLLKDL